MDNHKAIPSTSKSMTQVLTTDGKLQIVEVIPYDNSNVSESDVSSQVLQTISAAGSGQHKYTVLNTSKGLVQLDLLNLTLIKNEDGEESYQLVTNSGEDGTETVTCVLQSSDNEDQDMDQESYVVVNSMEDGEPLVYLDSTLQQINKSPTPPLVQNKTPAQMTANDILERAKLLQKGKAFRQQLRRCGRSRARKSDLPPPHELLASPNFKLYLYSCKWCSFKCNAVKEMTKHKAEQHRGGGRAARGGAALQCARCPLRAASVTQLMKHVKEKHVEEEIDQSVDSDSVCLKTADVLVCGACGFESASRKAFRRHIAEKHGATL